ncbi:MAG: hypothetical protein NT023_09405, partial [Armatimonadetes bacterium]|nr:hypothetical protein [Armatimonadota bacterium]
MKRVDGRGIETNYAYDDPESLLTSVKYVNNAQYNIAYQYDNYGRRIDIADAAGKHRRYYDDDDAVVGTESTYVTQDGTSLPTIKLGYQFNLDGSTASMSIANNSQTLKFQYGYDANRRMISLTNPFGEITRWGYLDNNWLQYQITANGVSRVHTYNPRGLLNDISYYASNGNILSDFGAMVYNANGDRLSKFTQQPGAGAGYTGLTAYDYDFKDQITQEKSALAGGFTHNFGYDNAGNAIQFQNNAVPYNRNNQRAGIGYAHDKAGNPSIFGGVGLQFDPENQMTTYGAAMAAGYRDDGLRAWKQNNTDTTYFIYDGFTPVVEVDPAGAFIATNTFGVNGLVSRHTPAGSVFYNCDPSGTVAPRLRRTG